MAKLKKKSLPASSLLVTQSNKLVEARYTLPLGEQRLLLSMIAQIQPGDDDFKEYRISINEFAEFMGIDKNHVYAECKKTTKHMLSRVLEIQEPGILVQTNWVSSAKYVDGEGCVRLCFDPLLKPYLLQLKSNFTSCRGLVEEPPKVFVLISVCLNVYRALCQLTKIALWLKRTHILFSQGLVHFTN